MHRGPATLQINIDERPTADRSVTENVDSSTALSKQLQHDPFDDDRMMSKMLTRDDDDDDDGVHQGATIKDLHEYTINTPVSKSDTLDGTSQSACRSTYYGYAVRD